MENAVTVFPYDHLRRQITGGAEIKTSAAAGPLLCPGSAKTFKPLKCLVPKTVSGWVFGAEAKTDFEKFQKSPRVSQGHRIISIVVDELASAHAHTNEGTSSD